MHKRLLQKHNGNIKLYMQKLKEQWNNKSNKTSRFLMNLVWKDGNLLLCNIVIIILKEKSENK